MGGVELMAVVKLKLYIHKIDHVNKQAWAGESDARVFIFSIKVVMW